MASGAGFVESVNVFDVYKGAPVPDGRKSVALAVVYRAVDRSLESEEIDREHSKLVQALRQRLGAEVRDA